VGIFPEGTRAPSGRIGPFHSGAFRLAQRTTEKVQPVVSVGSGRVWAKKQLWIRSLGPVVMKVLPPVSVPASAGRRELKQIIENTRQQMIDEHNRLERELFGDAALIQD
jgi:1-acyl-sn-glycerol-3-phosphate acyltransferase